MAQGNGFLDEELKFVKSDYKEIPGSELVACIPMMVRLKIVKNRHKDVTAVVQFPDNYPNAPVLIELKSKTLGFKLLEGLAKMCEEEAKKLTGKRQVMPILRFVNTFVDDNPLCVCSDEISHIKRKLLKDCDKIKLLQKQSQILLKICGGQYFYQVQFNVPDDYYSSQLKVSVVDHNFPEVLSQHFIGSACEITRKAVQPPLKKNPKAPPFEPKKCLKDVAEFLFMYVKRYPMELCPLCRERILPVDPKDAVHDPSNPKYIERVYCTHLFHHSCLDKYFKTPPFKGGKKCPECGQRIFHNHFKVTPELAEARWAHQEARRRELDEVTDFLK